MWILRVATMLTQLIYFARSLTSCSLASTCQDTVKAHIGAPLFPDAARSLLMKMNEEGVGEGVFANDDADEMPPYTQPNLSNFCLYSNYVREPSGFDPP